AGADPEQERLVPNRNEDVRPSRSSVDAGDLVVAVRREPEMSRTVGNQIVRNSDPAEGADAARVQVDARESGVVDVPSPNGIADNCHRDGLPPDSDDIEDLAGVGIELDERVLHHSRRSVAQVREHERERHCGCCDERGEKHYGPTLSGCSPGRETAGLSTWCGEAGVLVEDATLQLLELPAGLETQLRVEGLPGALIDVERVARTSGAIQREHELAVEALVERVLGDQPFELGNELDVASLREVRLDSVLSRAQPRFLEPPGRLSCKRFVAQLGKGFPAPQPERLTQQFAVAVPTTSFGEGLETFEIELARVDSEHITWRPRDQPIVAERPPKL